MEIDRTAAIAGLLCTAALSTQCSHELEEPVRLTSGDEPIDTGKDRGHAGPLFVDYDADGLPDLLVSSFRGNIRFFKNVGSRAEPEFIERDPLEAGGEPLRLHSW